VTDGAFASILVEDLEELVVAVLLDLALVAEREERLIGRDVELAVGHADIADVVRLEALRADLVTIVVQSKTGAFTTSTDHNVAV